jgi:hypothetical protein
MTSIYRFARDAGIMLSSYDLLRLISSIAAAATGVLFYLLLRERLGVSFQASLASTAGLCASYGFWRYANEAEVYAPAAALIVLGLWFALGDTRTHLAGAVVVFAVATFISILSLVPALIVVPFLIARRHGFRTATVYVASLSLVVATVAYATYQLVEHGTSSFLAFVNPPSSATSNWIAAAAQSVVGFGQSVVAGNFLLTKPSMLDLMEREFPTKVFQEERFLAAHTSPWMATIPFATLAILLVSLVLLGVLLLRAPRDPRGRSRLLLLFVAWILGYWLVAIRVDPGAPEAWTLILIPIWIVVGMAVFDRVGAVPLALIWLFVGALFVHNLLGGMLLMHDASTDFNVRKSEWLVDNTRSHDVVLTAAGSVFTRYLAYHADALVIGLLEPEAVERDYRLALATDGRVYITGDVLRPPPYIRDGQPTLYDALRQLSTQLRDNVFRVRSDAFGGVYLLNRHKPDTSGTLQGLNTCM